MSEHIIKNFDELATSDLRRKALLITEAGLDAINTEKVIQRNVSIKDHILTICEQEYNLDNYKSVRIIGFGKASCQAAFALDQILGKAVSGGVVIGITEDICQNISTYKGTHPIVSARNVELTGKVLDSVKGVTSNDLVIVIVSGGGSALLCWPLSECDQGSRLYESFLKTGGSIEEINIVRKHISEVKGGGLAKLLHPATVVSLIFSDVPGNHLSDVASGPTFKDTSTISDAQKIIDKYNLGEYKLLETPKEDIYFENIRNVAVVSNREALEAMSTKSKALGFDSKIISDELYDNVNDVADIFEKEALPGCSIIAGGEPKLIVTQKGGSGGRNQNLAMQMIKRVKNGQVFVSFASDGLDNGPYDGAIVDSESKAKSEKLGLDTEKSLLSFDLEPFWKEMGDNIMTGPTESNVSDLFFILSEK